MKNVLQSRFSIILALCLCFIYPSFGVAGIDLPWSTTYDCPDWNTYNDPLDCDGLGKNGAWTCDQDGPHYEQITSNANYSSGDGGKGQRHWLGDSLNDCSGGTSISFNAPQSEFWIRWYMRFESGFQWSSYQGFKILYFYDDAGHGNSYYMICHAPDVLDIYMQLGDHNTYAGDNCGWLTIYPGGTSDGSWNFFEVHLKLETPGQDNGVFQAWLNGNIVIDENTVNFGMANSGLLFKDITIGSNQKYPSNGRCMYVDYDDVAINNTEYIGPIDIRDYPSRRFLEIK